MSIKHPILEANGASIRPETLKKENFFFITDFGAAPLGAPGMNTLAFNKAIEAAAASGGGTVVIPGGTFLTYTIFLKSNVNLFLEENAVIAAARPETGGMQATGAETLQTGSADGPVNYTEPEVNPYAGLQDHGHSYFANSLLYGADLENIMIYGKGLITGGHFDEETGILEYILQGGDPREPLHRSDRGHRGTWFGNKGLALVRCKNVVLQDFSFTIGGHFAVIAEGCTDLYVENILIDTTRDAFDIDCCQDVTLRHTTCNSLTDDGICLKASFGAGTFMPTRNVLIEDCIVSGYDAGSVYAGMYTRDKLVAEDRCGPTGRVKFGTESTCGYHQVTIRRVKFDRSRGFALEAVDCSSLTDVLFEDCLLDNVSSSPIFIRAGDRGRFPVTGVSAEDSLPLKDDVRLDRPEWVLPRREDYHSYPPRRYTPHYNRGKTVTADGHSSFQIVDQENPVTCNPVNLTDDIPARDRPLYANASGCARLASVENILIRNVRATNADPRYPILLMGLTDSHLKNITLENIEVEYRGGLTMEHATEQRQLNTDWKFSQFHAGEKVQSLPWLVNSFFVKNEGLLPRADWNPDTESWQDDPYNVPELPDVYPEPSNWGILPAYGLFAKHVDGLTLRNIRISCKIPDGRHVCVLDDADGVLIDGLTAEYDPSGNPCAAGDTTFRKGLTAGQDPSLKPVAIITHHFRRHTNAENVPEQPYFTTTVKNLEIRQPLSTVQVEISAPAPGTPADSLYSFPTVPCRETGYAYKIDTDEYPLPLTVHRPYIRPVGVQKLRAGELYSLDLEIRCPASDISDVPYSGMIHGEQSALYHSVKGVKTDLKLSVENLPDNAALDAEKRRFCWRPDASQVGEHEVIFLVDDGVIPEKMAVKFLVSSAENP
ncbi:MAG: hypothetical protein NC420_04930 [Eubacterium sp.]|nr:hypothetical protein [Eubacterium sp.]MCM1303156.1 hypothetical protein [Butyrivibrio sp.]MCM1344242.1 hypothetical protein [Muribaculaceae bacterium]MCM1409471.1 hypothetical protein [Lachnospiraceae bacterium]